MTQAAGQSFAASGRVDYIRLRELLDEQETLFVRLDALSKRQSALIEREATDELLRVLGERQSVVESLDRAGEAMAPYRANWDEVLAGAGPDLRDRLSARVEELAALAGAIAARDDADRRLIEQRRDRLASDLSGVSNVRGAVAAYGQGGGRPAARFQDREV